MEKIKISDICFENVEISKTLEMLSSIENDEHFEYSADVDSVLYHYNKLIRLESLDMIKVSGNLQLIDGYHRLCAIALFNHIYNRNITDIDCEIINIE